MAGLGLSNAVRMYQQGADWRQERDDREKRAAEDAKQRATRDAAGAAWKSAMTPPMIEVDGGVDDDGQPMPKIARPDPKWDRKSAIIKGLGAVADVYATNGDMNGFMAVEARAAPLRAERRKGVIDQALASYRADKDPVKLAQSVYPEIYDGREITNAIRRDGKIEFSLSDGSKMITTPDELVTGVEYLRDPAAAAEFEAKTRWEAAKTRIDTEGKLTVEREKGRIERDTEDHKQGNRIGLENARSKNTRSEIGLRNAGDLAAVKARGEEDRKTASAKGETAAVGKRDAVYDQLHDEIIRAYGDSSTGIAGGNRVGNEATSQGADYARALMAADPKMTMVEAKRQAVAEMKKRGLIK